jgi:hypothetical protein
MKKHKIVSICLILIGVFLISCEENKKTTVLTDEANINVEDFKIEKDSTAIKVLKLPIYIDSTQFLYHPIAIERIYDQEDFSISKSRYKSYDTSANYNHYTFSGAYAGFIVEDMETGNKISVVKEEINISSVRIFNKLEHNPRVEFVIYEGYNLDTNKDEKLNYNDLKALFISDLNGANFTKLTLDFEELNGQKFIVENDQLYFQTQRDINNNGIFDAEDGYRNYVVDLQKELKTAVRYDDQLMKKS